MSNTAFDPVEQLAATLTELAGNLSDVNAGISRLEFMRQRIADELAAVRKERERLEMFTEAEAAGQLGLKTTHLADMRRARSPHFPHIAFGSKIMYSRRQLVEICEMYAVGSGQRSVVSGQESKLRRAA